MHIFKSCSYGRFLDDMTQAYLHAALWSSTDSDDNDEPFDSHHGLTDFSAETCREAFFYCARFLQDALPIIDHEVENNTNDATEVRTIEDKLAADQMGYDLWLTQAGHGTGFWDRGLGELGKKLTELAKRERDLNVVKGDDGKLYIG